MTLFDEPRSNPSQMQSAAPLATRMRPGTLDEFVGQAELLGPGKLLRQLIEQDQLASAIFYGPPGCGKSTLACIIAQRTRSHYETFSAVTSGIAEVRKVMEAARHRLALENRKTVLFIDEIHRFNKAQQDAFLPHVEAGTIVLIGATTENPYFSVNSPLLSRARVFRFEPLTDADLEDLVRRALHDEQRGLGKQGAKLEADALRHLLDVSNGDARRALNALELAVQAAAGNGTEDLTIGVSQVEQATQQRAIVYDADGDTHYDTVSAFIKSVRGSDVDAALYWLAKMIKAGEDPRFITRRLVILASEDIGNADPLGLVVATAAAHAVEYVGMPEAQLNLAQATTYLATAPKSNASYVALHRALEDVEKRPAVSVPPHLRDASYSGSSRLGHGIGYQYPHDFPGHYVPQEYLPAGARSQAYYTPADSGRERKIRERMESLDRLSREGGVPSDSSSHSVERSRRDSLGETVNEPTD
ncbi:MAG: replication-associated recombination protein A [Armatimonadetes bacterium]|nr:replication-associated recombination protein A [Armatimonadota bacterium]